MLHPQLTLDLNREIIVDNFAGGGGASSGIEIALGRNVDIAVNHDRHAVAMHQANHPQTRHFCESVYDVCPEEISEGRPIGLAWFSPDCKHFSKAKGGKPRDKSIRGLAWVVIKWVNLKQPRIIMLENVEEFQKWAPVVKRPVGWQSDPSWHSEWRRAKGKKHRVHVWTAPDGKRYDEGQISGWRTNWTYRCFVGALRRRGYTVESKVLRACDYGAPTIRKRLFLIARRDGKPIKWPMPTHSDPSAREPGTKPWRTAAECIDFDLPCPSIFERPKPLADNTCRRVAKGIMRYVIKSNDPYIVTKESGSRFRVSTEGQSNEIRCYDFLTEHANGSSQRVFNTKEPLRTQCAETKGGHFALVSAFLAKNYTGVVGTDLDDSIGTVTAKDHHSLVLTNLARHFGQSTGQSCDRPAPTVTADGQGKTGLVATYLSKMRGKNIGHSATDPLHTISAQGTHFAEVRAFLVKYYGTDQDPNLKSPLHTVTTKDRFAIVTVHGVDYAIADIGMRMLQPPELYRAQGFPEAYIIDHGHYIQEDGTYEWRKLTKTAQIRMCGNSVCPPLAAALVEANCEDLSAYQGAA